MESNHVVAKEARQPSSSLIGLGQSADVLGDSCCVAAYEASYMVVATADHELSLRDRAIIIGIDRHERQHVHLVIETSIGWQRTLMDVDNRHELSLPMELSSLDRVRNFVVACVRLRD